MISRQIRNRVKQTFLYTFLAFFLLAPFSNSITRTPIAKAASCPCSIWASSATPTYPNWNHTAAVELAVKFRSDTAGYITGVRFYKGVDNTGTHTGKLWTTSGQMLAKATFTNETATGWQQVNFANPVAISANTTYIAAYFAPNGHYAVDNNYFANAGVDNAPLHALRNGVDGANSVYAVGEDTFPTQTYLSTNYWVDVVFTESTAPDTTPPTVTSVTPTNTSTNNNPTNSVTATFNEPLNPASVSSSTFELRDPNNNLVPATVTYDDPTRTVTLDPTDALAYSETYTATLLGGTTDPRIKDVAGNALAANYTWSFSTATPPAPPQDEGAGGPILVISSAANPFTRYYSEILKNEGFNNFLVSDISLVTATTLANYDVAILGEMPTTAAQRTMLQDWVTTGGNLITMRPDKQLASFIGLTDTATTLSDGYLLIDTNNEPGRGLVNQTIQFHSTADRYTLNGATSVANLYNDATTATTNPAVTLRSIGSNGGQVAAFTYDLAKSVVWSRQGNPAWAGQERDSASPIRSNDMYTGLGGQTNWIDLNKVAIPQADEQQRLLGNLMTVMNRDKKPLPHFWYLKNGKKAAIVMTGDDHANGGTAARFDQYKAASTPNCSVQNWECIRSTSYIYPNAPLTNAQAASYTSDGFEVALHVNTGCADYTSSSLTANFQTQRNDFGAKYTSIPLPVTNRTHCMPWSDWFTHPQVEKAFNVRFDTNYYYWPPAWSGSRPGFFTASGFPMRFANTDGTSIDVFQATTQMTDESGQSYPFTVDSLLDKATGVEGYYGVFTVNMHTDNAISSGSDAIINSARTHNIPVVSSKQMLDWLDGKNSSAMNNLNWQNNTLTFTTSLGANTQGLQIMLPLRSANGTVQSVNVNNGPVSYTTQTIKGIDYAVISASAGNYSIVYGVDTTAPTVTSVSPANMATSVNTAANVTATFSEPMDSSTISGSTIELRDANNALVPSSITYDAGTNTATLDPTGTLAYSTVYTATVKGGTTDPRVKDQIGNALATNYVWSFTTAAGPVYNCPCTIWPANAVPGNPSQNHAASVEVGTKFKADANGYITGLRFYKGTGNTGTHTGKLWSGTGQQLAIATFTNETTTGWQQVNFSTPVAITAGTVYIVSYSAPNGHYAADNNYFANAGVDNAPLHALKDGVSGGNGVYATSANLFPTATWFATNYWVDPIFTISTAPDTTPPTVVSSSPTNNATAVSPTANITASFSEALNAATVSGSTVELRDSSNAVVPASVTYDSGTNTITLDPTSSLANSATYSFLIKGGTTDPRVKDSAGNALAANYALSFTTSAPVQSNCPCSIWAPTTTPANPNQNHTATVEVGVKFKSDVAGYIKAIRYYKSVDNTGTHTGKIWNTSGQILGRATFTNETATGWQQVTFATPIPIAANTTYIASYYTPVGHYAADNNFFANAGVDNGVLHALKDGVDGGNGVYSGGQDVFPTATWYGTNYWVDVVFSETP